MNTALMRTVQLILTNKSGGGVAQGDVVILDTTTTASFTTTTTSGYLGEPIGVVLEPNGIANNASGMIAIGGYVPVINLSGAASLGDFVKTHSVAKQGLRHATPSTAGDFAAVLNTGTTPPAFLFGSTVQIGAGGGGATVGTGTVASIPTPGTSGDVYLPSDGLQLYRSTGAAQVPWGPIYPLNAPDDASFAWINQGSATVDTTYGGIYLQTPQDNTDQYIMRGREIAYPATPFVITACIQPGGLDKQNVTGLYIRDSVTDKAEIFDIEYQEINVATLTKTTGVTTGPATYTIVGSVGDGEGLGTALPLWLQIEDTGAGAGNLRKWRASWDGEHFIELVSEGNTTFLTPNKIGFYVSNYGTGKFAHGVTLLSWKKT